MAALPQFHAFLRFSNPCPWRLRLAPLLLALFLVHAGRADEVEADGKIHVTYWEKWSGFEGEGMRQVVERFNRSQDRIIVDYFTTSSIGRKTLIATAGGDPPDVAGLWSQRVPQFAEAAALTPLEPFLLRDGFTVEQWLARYEPVYARICRYAGTVYAGISSPAIIAFHWNKTLFRQAGLDPDRPPRTIAELDAFSERLTRRDPRTGDILQTGFLPQDPGWWPWVFYAWFGGKVFDGENITIGTDPQNFAAAQWVASYTHRLGKADLQKFASGFGLPGSADAAFMSGKVAMILQGVWYNNYIQQYRPGLDYGVARWPTALPGLENFSLAEADVLVIPRGAKNPDAAWEFIKYVNSPNARAERFEDLDGLELLNFLLQKQSPLREWSPYFSTQHPHPQIHVFRELSRSEQAQAAPATGMYNLIENELRFTFEQIRLLLLPPDDALRGVHDRLSRAWSRYRLSLERHGQSFPGADARTAPVPSAP
ncbi:MAG TPA: extracellular solute-binding protein [Candidatus Synoicihabitans sp.]|nr:extracellular solute-binding protein [Candidatus Synoicihabitans sp.]